MSEKLNKEEIQKAKKEKKKWNKKAIYWHNAIPIFNAEIRSTFTEDVQTIFNFEQLELNKKLSEGIQWSNWSNVFLSILNIILGTINLFLLFSNINL